VRVEMFVAAEMAKMMMMNLQRETSLRRKPHDEIYKIYWWKYEDTCTLVKRAIPKENALLGAKLKLATVARTSMRPTCTAENFEE
jgi:hypothetical protein